MLTAGSNRILFVFEDVYKVFFLIGLLRHITYTMPNNRSAVTDIFVTSGQKNPGSTIFKACEFLRIILGSSNKNTENVKKKAKLSDDKKQ